MPDIASSELLRGGHAAILLLTLTILVAFLLLGWIGTTIRLRSLNRRLINLTRGVDQKNLEETLVAHLETVAQTSRRMDALEQAVAALQAQLPHCLQQVYMLRYDAFPDVAGEQSFTVALLDAKANGLLLTSVYTRQDVRVYAKAVNEGRSSHALSQEEQRALREAIHGD